MESQNQAIKVREAVNLIVTKLMNGKGRINGGGQSLNILENGLKRVTETLWPYGEVADDRIIDYLVYQLYRKREGEFAIQLSAMFSDYAIEKYRLQFIDTSGKSGMNYYIDQWLESAELTREKLVKMIEKQKPHPLLKFIYVEAEELIKKRFYNTEMGAILCQRSTTGWAPKSESCKGCNFKEQCKKFTEQRYPELLRLRMKDYNGKEK